MSNSKTIAQRMEEARIQAGAQNYKGHGYMDLARFDENTRHMIMEETASEEAAASTWEEKYLQGVILGIAAALVLILVIAIGAQIYQSIAGSSGGNDHAKR